MLIFYLCVHQLWLNWPTTQLFHKMILNDLLMTKLIILLLVNYSKKILNIIPGILKHVNYLEYQEHNLVASRFSCYIYIAELKLTNRHYIIFFKRLFDNHVYLQLTCIVFVHGIKPSGLSA